MVCFTTAWKEYDFRKGVDLSAQTNVTGTLLNQLIDNGTVNTNKGMIIQSTSIPNITDNPRYTNFLWFDRVTLTLKYYQGTGSSTTNWLAVIGLSAITGANISDYSIGNTKLGTNSVLEYAISAGAVTATKINDGQVVLGKLGLGSVTNGNLGFASVTYDKIMANTIQETNIVDAAITSNKLASSSINASKILDSSITAGKHAASSIYGTNIITQTIGSNNIAPTTINTTLLQTNITAGMVKAWAYVRSDGTLLRGHNLTVGRTATGKYTLTFSGGFAPGHTNYVLSGSCNDNSVSRTITVTTNLTDRVAIETQNTATGAAADLPFGVMIIDF